MTEVKSFCPGLTKRSKREQGLLDHVCAGLSNFIDCSIIQNNSLFIHLESKIVHIITERLCLNVALLHVHWELKLQLKI